MRSPSDDIHPVVALLAGLLLLAGAAAVLVGAYEPIRDGGGELTPTTRVEAPDSPTDEPEMAEGPLRGVTLSGADFGAGQNIGRGSGDLFSNLSTGQSWTRQDGGSYRYPDAGSLHYLAERGIEVVRVSFRWERLQPRLGHALDRVELRRLQRVIDEADEAGLLVIPAMMNYGAYWMDGGGLGVRHPIGSESVPIHMYADAWRRLAMAFQHHDNIAALALMNEPIDMPGGAATWEQAAIEAVEAIRSTGNDAVVAVPTYYWSNAHRVVAEHPAGPWMPDSLRPFVYEVHQYWSADRSGTYMSYAQELEIAKAEGWTATPRADELTVRALKELEQVVRWLGEEQGWIGEVGWPNNADVDEWNRLARSWFVSANAAGLWVTVWTTGAFWRPDYHLLAYRSSTGASGRLDTPTPIAEVLEENL